MKTVKEVSKIPRLLEILFFKELDLPLSTIKSMLDNPSYNRQQILQMQKSLLERKRNRLNGIIELINDAMEGVNTMNFELSGGQLNDATDAQYGAGVSKYIGKAIYKYYGI